MFAKTRQTIDYLGENGYAIEVCKRVFLDSCKAKKEGLSWKLKKQIK